MSATNGRLVDYLMLMLMLMLMASTTLSRVEGGDRRNEKSDATATDLKRTDDCPKSDRDFAELGNQRSAPHLRVCASERSWRGA